jgi:hypothetical protein
MPTADEIGESHLESILAQITNEEAASFKEHLEYRSQENRLKMRYEHFSGTEGGTEKLFDDLYHNTYQQANAKGLRGKTDPASVADTLELIVIGGLKGVNSPYETGLLKHFEAMKASGRFESDFARQTHLRELMSYLGASRQDVQTLVSGLSSGDASGWSQTVREFTNGLKDGIINRYIALHQNKTLDRPEKIPKFKAYVTKQLREEHGKTPEDLIGYLAPHTEPDEHVQQYDILGTMRRQEQINRLGLKDTPEKRRSRFRVVESEEPSEQRHYDAAA